jgi:hypothetical protein
MKTITTLKSTGLRTLTIKDAKNQLIATACKVLKKDNDHGKGMYRICIFGGIAHGKVAYAIDFQDLNDKSVEIANLT